MKRFSISIIFILIIILCSNVVSYCKEDAYLNGYRSYKHKDYDRAIDNFKKAIIDNPENFMAYWWLANVYIEKRMYKKAKNIISIADRIKIKPPKLPEGIFNDRRKLIGDEKAYYDRKKKAEKIYKEVEKSLESGNWDNSIKLSDRAINTNPLEPKYYETKGDILYDMGELKDCRILYIKSLLLSRNKLPILKKILDIDEKLNLKNEELNTLKKIYAINGDKNILRKINKLSLNRLEKISYKIIKRNGNRVFINLGLKDGLDYGSELRTKLKIVHIDSKNIINDISSATPLGIEDEVTVGRIMITKLSEDYSEAMIIKEYNGGIRVGDEIFWQQKNRM